MAAEVVSIADSGPTGRSVTAVAGTDLPRREARALMEFASRDPRVWRNIAATWLVVVGALGLALLVARPSSTEAQRQMSTSAAVIIVLMVTPTVWVSWYLSTVRKVRRAIASQCPPGTVIGSRFGADQVTFTIGGTAYTFGYDLLSRVVQFHDVLVVKAHHHLVLTVPVEAVDPRDLAHLRRRVVNEPMSRATAD